VAQARELAEEDQDAVADALFAQMANRDQGCGLTIEQVEEVKRIRARLRYGSREFASRGI
jgi:hypothetical protein